MLINKNYKNLKLKSWRMVTIALTLLLSLSFIAGLFSACPASDNGNNAPLTIIDQEGRTVTIANTPQKIISLSPGNTELLYSLGLGDRIAGVTDFCNYPAEALDKPKIGGFNTVDVEKVTEIGPDLILAGNIHVAEVVPALEALGFTVVVLEPKTLDDVMGALTLIGKIADVEDAAKSLIDDMRVRIKAITDKTASLTEEQKPRTLYLVWNNPLMSVGPDTIIHELIVLAGGKNIADVLGTGYPTISIEAVIVADPQVIIASSGHGAGADTIYLFAKEDELLADVSARINGRVYGILADLVSRPSVRLVEGLELIAKIIHPEIFGEVGAWQ